MLRLVCILVVVIASSVAQADPASMDDVQWPIDPPSMVAVTLAAGAFVVITVFGTALGFVLVRRLFYRLQLGVVGRDQSSASEFDDRMSIYTHLKAVAESSGLRAARREWRSLSRDEASSHISRRSMRNAWRMVKGSVRR